CAVLGVSSRFGNPSYGLHEGSFGEIVMPGMAGSIHGGNALRRELDLGEDYIVGIGVCRVRGILGMEWQIQAADAQARQYDAQSE
ncbi:MAG: hypothetical protein KAU36_09970, partial [candidate division Zixibacteria bacterium]|nr:hypothetical protein [candidate division Zixibacteria bacterium]